MSSQDPRTDHSGLSRVLLGGDSMVWVQKLRLWAATGVLGLFLVLPLVPIFANAAEDLTPDQVRDQITLLLTHQNPVSRSAAATTLKSAPYLEVRDALLKAIEKELSSARPNGYVLEEALKSLLEGEFLSSDEVVVLERLKILANQKASWFSQKIALAIRASSSVDSRDLQPLPAAQSQSFFLMLGGLVSEQKLDPDLFKILQIATEGDLTDEIVTRSKNPESPRVVPRRAPAIRALEVLARMKGRIPVFTGEAGVGKTAVAEELALMIYERDFDGFEVFDREFPQRTFVLKTSAARISRLAKSDQENAQALALENYLEAIRAAEKALEAKVILMIDEVHTLSKAQLNALKPVADSLNGVSLIGATTHKEFMFMVAEDRAVERRLQEIEIEELSAEQTLEVLKGGWAAALEKRYHVKIDETFLKEFIPVATELRPELSRPEAQIKTLQDFVIRQARMAKATSEKPLKITIPMLREYAGSISGVPINPNDTSALIDYMESGKQKVRERVIGQDHINEALVELWQGVLTSNAREAAKSAMILGGTGIGKTLIAETMGEVFLGSSEKVLVVDCTAYQTGDLSLNALIGAPPGTISSDKTKGVLPEFLSGRGKHAGIIVFNEVDKAHPDLQTRLMEMFDRKELTGGDGRIYRLRRHLLVLTSNRNAHLIFNRNLGHMASDEEIERRVKGYTQAQLREFFLQSPGYAFQDKGKLKPEIVNRIDRWLVAKPLSFKEAQKIARLEANKQKKVIETRYRLSVELKDDVIELLTQMSFVAADGARPVRKRIETAYTQVQNVIWKQLKNIEGAKVSVSVRRDEENKPYLVIRSSRPAQLLGEIAIEDPTKFMALDDPRFVQKLVGLDAEMRSLIYGQDEAVEEVVAAVKGRAARPFEKAPLSIWLLGQTGNGKSAMGKALAKALYGDAERARTLKLGDVQSDYNFNDIFSPPKGIVGSDEPGRFEEILQSFPEGGVIIWDEIGNMGMSATPAQREALFMKLYDIFGEGTWTSPLGKTYDLSKYVMILTGNDGQEFFAGAENADLIKAARKEYADRDKLKKMLKEKHVPEAFINRITAIVLTNPLIENTRKLIAQKFLKEILQQYESTYRIKIQYSDDFLRQISEWFFPAGDNARGAERFIKRRINDLLASFILESYEEIKAIPANQTKKIELVLTPQFSTDRPWAVREEPVPQPFFALDIKDVQTGRVLKSAKPKADGGLRLTPLRVAEEVAIHEAGHALVNEYLDHPRGELEFLTIESRGDYGGYARYEDKHKRGTSSLKDIVKSIAVMAAGRVAVEVHGIEDVIGWAGSRKSDKGQMDNLALRAILQFGLVSGLENLVPNFENGFANFADLSDSQKMKVQEAMDEIIGRGVRLAHAILSDPGVKETTKRLAQHLIDRGSLNADEYQAIMQSESPFDAQGLDEILVGTNQTLCSRYLKRAQGGTQ